MKTIKKKHNTTGATAMSPSFTSVSLPINKLRKDGGTQPRVVVIDAVVEEYYDSMKNGAKFPPVDVFFDGTDYWLADGFHRSEAADANDFETIECIVHQGTREDAQWFSFAANKTNGHYRSNADKQRAVQAALAHPKSEGLSDSVIADHVGVSQRCVNDWRRELASTQKDAKLTKRRGRDGRVRNTENIGRKAKPAVAPQAELEAKPADPAPEPIVSPIATAVKPAVELELASEPVSEPEETDESLGAATVRTPSVGPSLVAPRPSQKTPAAVAAPVDKLAEFQALNPAVERVAAHKISPQEFLSFVDDSEIEDVIDAAESAREFIAGIIALKSTNLKSQGKPGKLA